MQHKNEITHSCHGHEKKLDLLLWGSLGGILLGFVLNFSPQMALPAQVYSSSSTIVDLMTKMAWGLVFAIVFVGLLNFVPREKMNQILGTKKGLQGIIRATLAGVILDLCSHGILLVGMKLYERGAGIGQVVAFLVASPWNAFSMTLILWSLIGLKLTLVFIALSCVVAVISGLIFERLVDASKLPKNPYQKSVAEVSGKIKWFDFKGLGFVEILKESIRSSFNDSKMILRWIFFGVLLTAFVKEALSPENFQYFFGSDYFGVFMTIAVATVLEVCSEGSAPLAAEIVTSAKAPGNGFSFLMAGVSTDYTEIMAIKETTKSWKTAFFLPLVTLPQIIILGILLNIFG